MFKKIVLTLELELHMALNILTKPIGFVLIHFATSWTVLNSTQFLCKYSKDQLKIETKNGHGNSGMFSNVSY